ncbi:MAG TPA: hypothetical protein VEB42_13125, partial [Chitinophagaceae bacterium]|nr:hypothetical protein [Chitinophagaceae bacterium]
YGTPDQKELDALFGTEVGDRSHYFKTMVRDANGQYSVSYSDMHGRTIATALAGNPVQHLEPLASNVGRNITETLSDPSSAVIKDLVMESRKGLLVPVAAVHTFTYNLTPQSLQMEGCTGNVCYDCLYDLQITITDDCNNQKLGGHAFDTVFHNFSLGAIDTSCANGAAGFSVSFSKYLEEGSYEVTKKLSVSREGMDYYRDSLYLARNTCKNIDSFIVEQRRLLAAVMECKPACQSCSDSVGTWATFQPKFMTRAGIAIADTASYRDMAWQAYVHADSACKQLCGNVAEHEDVRKSMLLDMTPASGQYAKLEDEDDQYSIFFSSVDGISPDTVANYRRDNNYRDEKGNIDSVFDESSGIFVRPERLSPEAFVRKFKLSWAEALLQYHPEYCKLVEYEKLKGSHDWDRKFEAVDNFREAYNKGYLNPTANTGGTYTQFGYNTANHDPLSDISSYKTALEAHLIRYRNNTITSGGLSMWGLASATVMCKDDNTATCYNTYATSSNAFDTTAMCKGDLDMAWRAFRQMYLDIKRELVNASLNSTCGNPTAINLITAGHQPHFGDATGLTSQNPYHPPADKAQAEQQAQAQLNVLYDANCAAYVKLWW